MSFEHKVFVFGQKIPPDPPLVDVLPGLMKRESYVHFEYDE